MREPPEYVGRFAPSPTGPLHFGSLLAAVASRLEAHCHGGRWLLRIEDIDPPRERPGATRRILEALERYGFEWDGPVIYQSRNETSHRAALKRLLAAGQAYPCGCSRRDLLDAPAGLLGRIYPGTCRNGSNASEFAIRVRTDDSQTGFADRLQGTQHQRLESESGDFVVLRRDGLIAYQLAVVVDDYEQGISDVVRGIDLMDSTPRQIWLQRLLGYPTPSYAHIPIATNAAGIKLSKNTGAPAVSLEAVEATLIAALKALRQSPPDTLASAGTRAIWDWSLAHWDLHKLDGYRQLKPGNHASPNTARD